MTHSIRNENATQSQSSRRRRKSSVACLLVLTLLALVRGSLSQSTPSDKKNSGVSATTGQPGRDMPHVKLRMTETVSSADAKVGQLVSLEVVDPVQVDGKVIIAAGAPARASVTAATRRGHNHREGQLILTVQSVSRADGGGSAPAICRGPEREWPWYADLRTMYLSLTS
jgi:hypothetical protein